MSTDVSTEDRNIPKHLFGLAASFDSPEAIKSAAHRVTEAGYTQAEAYTPFAVTGLPEALGTHRTWMAPAVLAGAVLGGAGGFFMQWYANVIDYPWNVGGRPPNSWPMFIPITFELAVLCGAVLGVIAMLALNRLPHPYHPMFRVEGFDRATRDRFFLCVETSDPRFDLAETRKLLESLQPIAVLEVPR